MKVKDLFDIYQGNGYELINMVQSTDSDINFVSRTSENNGVVAKVDLTQKETFLAGLITVAVGGSVLSSFVQNKPFYTGFHVLVLKPKKEMSLEEKLFYCSAIKKNAYRYGYGRQANKTLKDINLPKLPAWIKTYKIDYTPIQTHIEKKDIPFDVTNWKQFKISDLFDVKGTKTTKLEDLEVVGSGIYPYVTTQSVDNGIAGYYNTFTEEGNVITADSAVVGFCSYQEKPFSASDHVEKLIPKFNMNKFNALFIITILNKENYRYSYGRKFNQAKIKDTIIKLPVDSSGSPDWLFMENYIKSLPYSDLI